MPAEKIIVGQVGPCGHVYDYCYMGRAFCSECRRQAQRLRYSRKNDERRAEEAKRREMFDA